MPRKGKSRGKKAGKPLSSSPASLTNEHTIGVARPVGLEELPKFAPEAFSPPSTSTADEKKSKHANPSPHSEGFRYFAETPTTEVARVVRISSVFTHSRGSTQHTLEEKESEKEVQKDREEEGEEEFRPSTAAERIPSGEVEQQSQFVARYSNFSAASEDEVVETRFSSKAIPAVEDFSATSNTSRKRQREALINRGSSSSEKEDNDDSTEDKEKSPVSLLSRHISQVNSSVKRAFSSGITLKSGGKSAHNAFRQGDLIKPALSLFPQLPLTPPPPPLKSSAANSMNTPNTSAHNQAASSSVAPGPFFHHFLSMQPMRVRIGTVPLPPYDPSSLEENNTTTSHRSRLLSAFDEAMGVSEWSKEKEEKGKEKRRRSYHGENSQQHFNSSRDLHMVENTAERLLNPKKFFQLPANAMATENDTFPSSSPLQLNLMGGNPNNNDDDEGTDVLGWAGIFSELPIYLEGSEPNGQEKNNDKEPLQDNKQIWMGAGSVSVVLSTLQ